MRVLVVETLENRYNKLKEQFDKLNSEKTKMEGEKEVYKKELKAMGFASLKEAINKKEELEAEQKKLEQELEQLLIKLEHEVGINQ